MIESLTPGQLRSQASDMTLPRQCRLASQLLADAIDAWPEPTATLREFAERLCHVTGQAVTRANAGKLAFASDRRNDGWTGEALDTLTRVFELLPGCASVADLDAIPAARWRMS
jgi:hypothetical protein